VKQLILVDGHALFHRAYHAMPALTTSKGELVNAVYGFTAMLLRVIEDVGPEYIVVTFDTATPTFRHQEYTAYKANRTAAPDGLHEQLPRVKEVVEALNIPIFELPGFEADDLIGTLARQATENGIADLEVYIVTGDRDAIQLVTDRVKVYTPGKSLSDVILFDEKKVSEKYGFAPKQLVDYKALAGDSSDNIPGVRGIGEVSATKLVQQYGSVEEVYKHLDELPERQQKLLAQDSESAVLSKKLATIDVQVPIQLDLEKCSVRDYDKDQVVTLFTELEFKSLLAKLPKSDQVGFGLFSGESVVTASEAKQSSGEEIAAPAELARNDKGTTPLQRILTEMTEWGVLIDQKILRKQATDLTNQLVEIEKKIYSAVGHEFNLNSPSQLAAVLYEELGLTPGRKKKTHYSTDQETLTSLIGAHPAIELLLSYRELFKLKSTYLDALPQLIAEDGRIHTQWNAEGTRTGRLSSTNPNLQNIPVKGEWGSKIRTFFVAPADAQLIAADYNQIELRVMAHMSEDPALVEIFKKGQDIHATTAGWIFSKKPTEVTKDERRVAKTVNFGVLYGQSPFGLAQQLKIDPKVASKFIERYYTRFAKVKEYQEKILVEAKEKGYLETLGGFRRYLLELQSPNYQIRAAGERMAINMPIQGTAADIIKQAMINLDKIFKTKHLGTKMILQVHDELVFEVPAQEVASVTPIIKKEMEEAMPLSVPVVVELKIGQNWGDTQPLSSPS
jgi:DNA polymerase I-like protein with 3'-5' exonuclease and polymerase domains/5'-3' exonuclease